MRIALLGATGRTGRLVLLGAVRGGHQVSALARTPDTLTDVASEVRVVPESSADRDAVHRVLEGADLVISALGPTSSQVDLHSRTGGGPGQAPGAPDVRNAAGPVRQPGTALPA
jgi:putative NADH-flavin reductase